jgi:Zn-dependent protease
MYSFRNLKDKLRRYAQFNQKEIKGLVLSIIVIAFILSFRDWGKEEFSVSLGAANFILTLLIVAISYTAHQIAQRVAAVSVGYQLEYKAWIVGLIVGLVLAFVSNGVVAFLALGGFTLTHLAVHRLGRFRYGLNYSVMGWIALAGPLANVALAIIFKSLGAAAGGGYFFTKAVSINLWLALFSMIPIPPFDGSKTFFGSRYIYMFALGAIAGIAVLLKFVSSILYAILGSLAIGFVLFWVFFVYVDKQFK